MLNALRPKTLLRAAIRCYQLFLSPILPPSCRYLPSCSDYAAEAITRHGALKGSFLALCRLARCHPWGGSGYDPVPDAPSATNHHHIPHAHCRHS